jgi:peptidoglycan DL-endopeptidase CwlO
LVSGLGSGLGIPRASADQISDLRAQADALANRIQTLGQQDAALVEQYDGDVLAVQTLQGKVAQAATQVASDGARVSTARQALEQDAIQAYVHGGSNPLTSSSNSVSNATNSLLRAEYVDSLAADQSSAIDQYHYATLQDQAAKVSLQKQTTAAQRAAQQVLQDRKQVDNTQAQLQAEEGQVKGQIATLVAQQEAAEQAAAQARAAAAAKARAAQQAAAAQAAAQRQQAQQAAATQQAAASQATQPAVTSQPAEPATTSAPASPAATLQSAPTAAAPPVGSGAAGAVAAALSRVGDPYVWGAAGPNAFDCSGLVMWAYAQVGISLPHFSGAQFADTTQISMSDLEPGDLVFPADPGQHVAMYIGGGMIVQAPFTGEDVQVVPLSSFFVLATRVA